MDIFTTGAFIQRKQMQNGLWVWIVTRFEDDTFIDGEEVNVIEESTSKEGLIDDIDGVLR